MTEAPGDRLRVLHATPAYAPAYGFGGPVRSVEGLVHALRDHVDVRVLTTDADAGKQRLQVHTAGRCGVTYVRAWVWPDITPTTSLCALRALEWADILHVTAVFNVSSAQALAVGVARDVPVVLSPRGALQSAALAFRRPTAKRLWLAGLQPLYRRVAAFHATSATEAEAVRQAFGVRRRVETIPNAVDVPAERAVLEARSGLREAIGFVGRIHPIKAIENLIRAYAALSPGSNGPAGCALWLVGPEDVPGYSRDLRRLAEALGVSASVRFMGELPQQALGSVYARCKVIVVPSHSENFSNVVPEALSWETPVVTSEGTPWSALEDWGAGRWVPNDPGSLCEAIRGYVEDDSAARAAGGRGRAIVEERFAWDVVAARMLSLYRSVVRAPGAGRTASAPP